MKKYNDYHQFEQNPFINQDYKYANTTGIGCSMKISNDYKNDKMSKIMQFPEVTNLDNMRDNYITTISNHLDLTKAAHNLLSYLITDTVGFHKDSPLFTLRKRKTLERESKNGQIMNWIDKNTYLVALDQDDFNLRYGYRNRFSMLSAIRELLEKKLLVRASKSKYGTLKEYFLHPAIFDTRNLATISVTHSTHSPDKQELEEDVERLQEEFERKKDLLTKM